MRKYKHFFIALSLFAVFTLSACAQSKSAKPSEDTTMTPIPTKKTEEITATPLPKPNILEEIKKLPKINVTSKTLNEDGKWKSIITYTNTGENKSPELSWEPVENATNYAIYMFDITAQNWLHWIVTDLTETKLELNTKFENSEYIGPYPPEGRPHTYVVSVYALAGKPDQYSGTLDSQHLKPEKVIEKLDTSNEKPGNILAFGSLSGTFTYGETVK